MGLVMVRWLLIVLCCCFELQKNVTIGCGMVHWIDRVMCNRARRIIPGLLKRINNLEQALREHVAENDFHNKGKTEKSQGGEYEVKTEKFDGLEVNNELKTMVDNIANETRKIKLYLSVIFIGIAFLVFFK